MDSDIPTAVLREFRYSDKFFVGFRFRRVSDFFLVSKIVLLGGVKSPQIVSVVGNY